MTDPLIEIAEEMERVCYSPVPPDNLTVRAWKEIGNAWAARIREIAASKEAYTDPCDVCGTGMFQACPKCDERILNLSPQRKAFVEAAIAAEAMQVDDSNEYDWLMRKVAAERSRLLAYRALVESERGESEGR